MKILILLLIASAASGIRIGCRYTLYTYVGTIIQEVPTCNVISMDFTDNPTHITFANGTAEQIQRTQILYFGWPHFNHCRNFNLTFVPQGISNVFPNMTGLVFNECAITNLVGNELEGYPNLETWMISYSKLTNGRIPGSFFAQTPNMKMISFWDNGIREVGRNLLDHLEISLVHLWFANNVCVSTRASTRTEIINLIQTLKVQCPDTSPIVPSTTTTTTPSSANISKGSLAKLMALGILVISLIKRI